MYGIYKVNKIIVRFGKAGSKGRAESSGEAGVESSGVLLPAREG